jgi:hypothetical protein
MEQGVALLAATLSASCGYFVILGLFLYYDAGGGNVEPYNVTCPCGTVLVEQTYSSYVEPDEVYSSLAFLVAALLLVFYVCFTYGSKPKNRMRSKLYYSCLYILFTSFICSGSIGYHLWPGNTVSFDFDRWTILLLVVYVFICLSFSHRLGLSFAEGGVLAFFLVGVGTYVNFVFTYTVAYAYIGACMVSTLLIEVLYLVILPAKVEEVYLRWRVLYLVLTVVFFAVAFVFWVLQMDEVCSMCSSGGLIYGHLLWHVFLSVMLLTIYLYFDSEPPIFYK